MIIWAPKRYNCAWRQCAPANEIKEASRTVMPIENFRIRTTSRREVVDITSEVEQAVAASGCREGLLCLTAAHCTCTIYVNENERGLVADTLELVSKLTASGAWRHNRIDDNAEAHLATAVMGNSVCLPVSGGQIELGTWQRIMLLELDGPRERRVTVTVIPG